MPAKVPDGGVPVRAAEGNAYCFAREESLTETVLLLYRPALGWVVPLALA